MAKHETANLHQEDNESSFEQDKLKLLTDSKNLLLLAEQGKLDELDLLQQQWQEFLRASVAKHGDLLEPVRMILLQDQQLLAEYLKKNTVLLTQEFSQNLRANKSVKKYLDR